MKSVSLLLLVLGVAAVSGGGGGGGGGLVITKMSVPDGVENGSGFVVLDCEYKIVDESEKGLNFKWYFGDTTNLVYQWVPNGKPGGKGMLRDRVDLNFSIPDGGQTRHSSLKILRVAEDLTGRYTCKVETESSEDQKSDTLIVYDSPDEVEIGKEDVDDEHVNITCTAYGVYPRPNIEITYDGDSDTDDDESDVELSKPKAGEYNGTYTEQYKKSDLADPTTFRCFVTIPGVANSTFSVNRTLLYHPRGESASIADNSTDQSGAGIVTAATDREGSATGLQLNMPTVFLSFAMLLTTTLV